MPDDDDVAFARESLRHSVWSGFETAEDREMIIGDLLLEDADHDEPALRAYVAAELTRKAAAEFEWPAVTDCDRLDSVFAGLAAERILGLHNAGNTMSECHGEAAERLTNEPAGRFIGYCFYHWQDIERVLDGGPLHIAFDHVDGEGPDRLLVGRRVDAGLRAAGFATSWDGTTARRIALPSFDWKRRGP